MRDMQKPAVLIYSEYNALALSLVENLLSNFCTIRIITEDKERWTKNLGHIISNSDVDFISKENREGFIFEYVVNISLSTKKVWERKEILKLSEIVAGRNVKSLLIFSYRSYSKAAEDSFALGSKTGVIYIGDLFGPRMDLTENFPLSMVLQSFLSGNRKSKNFYLGFR